MTVFRQVDGTVQIAGRVGPHPLKPLLHVPDRETDLARRGVIPVDPARAEVLRDVARSFIAGCNAMFGAHPFLKLDMVLAATSVERHGFVAEGAAMGALIRDALSFRGGFLDELMRHHGARFEYLMAVGAGWGLAKLPWRRRAAFGSFAPTVRGLAWDGHGFHDTYFHPRKVAGGRLRRFSGAMAASYDAGIGRALWFLASGNGPEAVRLVREFDAARHPDLLAGLGLALGYAGQATADDWQALLTAFPDGRANLLQGLAFAAEAHRRAGTWPASLDLGAGILGGVLAEVLADTARDLRPTDVPDTEEAGLAAYDGWRRALTDTLSQLPGASA